MYVEDPKATMLNHSFYVLPWGERPRLPLESLHAGAISAGKQIKRRTTWSSSHTTRRLSCFRWIVSCSCSMFLMI